MKKYTEKLAKMPRKRKREPERKREPDVYLWNWDLPECDPDVYFWNWDLPENKRLPNISVLKMTMNFLKNEKKKIEEKLF